MQFSDTTNKNGILQTIERWTNLTDGAITGDTTLIKTMTASVNDAFNTIMPLLLSWSNYLKWDDTTNTDQPIGTFDIVSGQPDYTLTQDGNSLDILNITGVRILQSATGTFYYDLKEMDSGDQWAQEAMSPNSTITGIPNRYLKRGNTIYLFPKPNYSSTAGAKIYFERQPNYFVSTDTTKEPGIPGVFHILLALYPAYEYVLTNKSDQTNLITRLEARIAKEERALKNAIDGRNPHRYQITTERLRFR